MATAIDLQVSFSHIQLYVDDLQDVAVYQQLQTTLHEFHEQRSSRDATIQNKKRAWEALAGSTASSFVSHGRDIVKQLIAGLGFRITRAGPQRLLVTSSDPEGVQFIIMAGPGSDDSSGIFSRGTYDS